MKKLLLFLFFTTSVFAETPNDSIPKKMSTSDLFSDYDIVLIDSLLTDCIREGNDSNCEGMVDAGSAMTVIVR